MAASPAATRERPAATAAAIGEGATAEALKINTWMMASAPTMAVPSLILPRIFGSRTQRQIRRGTSARRAFSLKAGCSGETGGGAATSSLWNGFARAYWAAATPMRIPAASPSITAASSRTGFESQRPPASAPAAPTSAATKRTSTTPRYGSRVG